MNFLQERIEQDGTVLSGHILKVNNFLNHTVDPKLMAAIGKAFADQFKDLHPTKVLTIESGGIAPALMTALELDVPLVYCKKAKPSTMNDPISTEVFSFTKQQTYTMCMERPSMSEEDRILFIDDFLANGQAFKGIEDLVNQTGATLVGCGFCIEKAFQDGRPYILEKGYPLYSLAPIAKLEEDKITWLEETE